MRSMMTVNQSAIYHAIAGRKPGDIVTYDDLAGLLPDRTTAKGDRNRVHGLVGRVKRRLARLGIAVVAINDVGYCVAARSVKAAGQEPIRQVQATTADQEPIRQVQATLDECLRLIRAQTAVIKTMALDSLR